MLKHSSKSSTAATGISIGLGVWTHLVYHPANAQLLVNTAAETGLKYQLNNDATCIVVLYLSSCNDRSSAEECICHC